MRKNYCCIFISGEQVTIPCLLKKGT